MLLVLLMDRLLTLGDGCSSHMGFSAKSPVLPSREPSALTGLMQETQQVSVLTGKRLPVASPWHRH